eukprot:Sspe_Gene.41094::Locus_19865_Transcript_1_1_Confidence_1.000_Length_726::g.41094::m.41094
MRQLLQGTPVQVPTDRERAVFRAAAVLLLAVVAISLLRSCPVPARCAPLPPPPSLRYAVAFVIRNPVAPDEVLTVKRPYNDDLPGVVGLPATTVSSRHEEFRSAVRRGGREKLGVALEPGRFLGRGSTKREKYILYMEEYEATLVNATIGDVKVPQPAGKGTQYLEWRWNKPNALRPAAERGSLCSQIFLSSLSE